MTAVKDAVRENGNHLTVYDTVGLYLARKPRLLPRVR